MIYSEQNPLEIKCSDLPSRGVSYGIEKLSIRPLNFEDTVEIGESDSTGDDLPFVLAINRCVTNLDGFLDVSDFYLVAAIVRLISMHEMPITMKWTCAERHLKLKLDESTQELQEALTSRNFVYDAETSIWQKNAVSEKEYHELNSMIQGKGSGSWYTCSTPNTFDLTVQHLLKHVKQLPENSMLQDLEHGFRFPNSLDIAEYKRLSQDKKIARLMRVCMWIDESYGNSLEARFNYLRNAQTQVTMHLIQTALRYDQKYTAGLSKIIVSGPCSACGSATHTAVVTVTPKMFFVQ